MTDADLLAFILRVLRVTGQDGCDLDGWLSWSTDGEYAPVSFVLNCNDVFAWACADGEDLRPEDVDDLERAYRDIKSADPDDCTAGCYAVELFCSRKRNMRPQGAAYPKNRKLWPLFDACGPERPTGRGNPHPPGGKGAHHQ